MNYGSSPHTWGILPGESGQLRVYRFIPTYVGHTPRSWLPCCPGSVHPHIRGAYGVPLVSELVSDGSSPHTWGILRVPGVRQGPGPVHPHIRGAYLEHGADIAHVVGSSPHTWGIRAAGQCQSGTGRFIPTYVGHTKLFRPVASQVCGSSPHTWGIHWTAVRKMAGFSHFSYDFIQKSYFVQGLVFFGVIGAEASLSHRRGQSQCLPGAHGGSVRNL